MASPVVCDFPIVPIVQYEPASPPLLPAVVVPPEVSHLLPVITSTIINEVGFRAFTNKARMFCYNLLVNNFWQNENFNEVVHLVAGSLCLKVRKQEIRFPDHAVKQTVEEVLALYTGNLVLIYPDLKSQVDNTILNVAYQNSNNFNQLKQEIHAMSFNQPGNLYPGNVHMPQNNMGGFGQTSMMQQPMYPQQMQQGMYQPMMQQPMYHQQMQQGMYQPMMQQPMYPQQMQQPMYPQQTQNTVFSDRAWNSPSNSAPVSESRFDIKQGNYLDRYADKQQTVEEVKPAVEKVATNKVNYLTVLGDTEMDRAKHQITFFNDSFSTEGTIRNNSYEKAVATLAEAKADEELNIHVYNNWLLEDCLEAATTSGLIKKYDLQQSLESNQMFRCFALVTESFVSTEDISSYMASLKTASDFNTLAIKIKSLATSIEAKKKELKDSYGLIALLSRIDLLLTKLINDFLDQRLDCNVNIELFSSDVSILHDHLSRKNFLFGKAYREFEAETIGILTTKLNEDTYQAFVENLSIPEHVNYSYLLTAHSFTYTFMMAKELGYNVQSTPLVIDKDLTPLLYSVAESLQKHKKENGYNTNCDWLITADNVKYIINKSSIKDNVYTIMKP